MLSLSAGAMAIPAKRGLWRTIRTADGQELRATLQGDELVHYYQTADGQCYTGSADGTYVKTDPTVLADRAKARRRAAEDMRRSDIARGVGGTGKVYEGKKKGLIILVQFDDLDFSAGHDLELYKRIANEQGFTSPDGFKGSVKDYFRDQSLGRLEVDFDVVGPVTMPKPAYYYGENVGFGDDAHPGEMVGEACLAIDSQVNFADYDWDGDGVVDQVFVLYAGLGEAAGGSSNTIWPHQFKLSLSDYHKALNLDGVTVDTYACSCELTIDYDDEKRPEVIDGIGTICHEFSHCLGYADVYDTSRGGSNFGMDRWDLMDYGSYNNGGFTPSGYTAYERWVAGWITPEELTADTKISGLKTIADGGKAYIIYNNANENEFIILENRRQSGWDAAQLASGLIAMHIDYDADVWAKNAVNNDKKRRRYTLFTADGTTGHADEDLAGDLFPYDGLNALNCTSLSKPLWNTPDADGRKSIGKSFMNITRDDDGDISFDFFDSPVERDAYVLLETFDDNDGEGGNDGLWQAWGGSTLKTDLEGWTGVKQFNGAQCARFGTKSTPGSVTSPEFEAEAGMTLSCLAGPWTTEKSTMTVSFINSADDAETVLGTFDINEQAWKKCEMTINVSGRGRLKFASSLRQYLDEVRVCRKETNGIHTATRVRNNDTRVYSIDGRYLGDDISRLGHGLYIVGGKKVVK